MNAIQNQMLPVTRAGQFPEYWITARCQAMIDGYKNVIKDLKPAPKQPSTQTARSKRGPTVVPAVWHESLSAEVAFLWDETEETRAPKAIVNDFRKEINTPIHAPEWVSASVAIAQSRDEWAAWRYGLFGAIGAFVFGFAGDGFKRLFNSLLTEKTNTGRNPNTTPRI